MASPRRRVDARQRKVVKKEENRDNVMAMKVLAGAVAGVLVLILFISLGSGDPKPIGGDQDAAEREANRDRLAEIYGPDGTGAVFVPEEGKESEVPASLAKQLLLAIATEDTERLDELISWPALFGKLADENAWEAERRWENRDDAGREQLKTDWTFQLLDPDLVMAVGQYLKADILANAAPPDRSRVGDRFGEIMFIVRNERGKDLVVFHIMSYLLDGYTPQNDYYNEDAWRIVKVGFDVRSAIGSKKKSKNRKDIGADLGKPEKKRRAKRKRFTGPVEADVAPVAWTEGTTDATRGKIESLVKDALDDSGRKSAGARDQLVNIGKPAIPGLLNAVAAINWKDRAEFRNVLFLIDTLEMITGEVRGVTGSVRLGGLTPPSPDVIEKGLRRWFGWWNEFGPAWVKEEYDPSKETWEQFEEDDEDDGSGK